jgi:hypothetical protein
MLCTIIHKKRIEIPIFCITKEENLQINFALIRILIEEKTNFINVIILSILISQSKDHFQTCIVVEKFQVKNVFFLSDLHVFHLV